MLERNESGQGFPDLYVLPNEQTLYESPNVTPIQPYLERAQHPVYDSVAISGISSADAYVQVVRVGMETNIDEDKYLFEGYNQQPHYGKIVSSEIYNLKQSGTGRISGFFMQYEEGYKGSDEYGLYHPGTTTESKMVRKDGKWIEEDHERKIGYTGNETIRVLKVDYDPVTNQIQKNYLHARDLRYAIEDKRRLDKVRRELRLLADDRTEFYNQPEHIRAGAGMIEDPDWMYVNDIPMVAD